MTNEQLTPEQEEKFRGIILTRNNESNELLEPLKKYGFKNTGMLPCFSCPEEFRSYKYDHVLSKDINLTLLPDQKRNQFILVIPGIIKRPSVAKMEVLMETLAKHFKEDGSLIR